MTRRALFLLAALPMLGNPSPASADLLSINGGFESGLDGWTSGGVAIVESDTFEGLAVDNTGHGHVARLGGDRAHRRRRALGLGLLFLLAGRQSSEDR